ncbi:hypothetical protein PENSPDRAFT_752659 [Peniophora sp. CONT]|nr:hypothetical protein PENSPDRAFT_752659 [Peniophora sp. CONT]
MSRDASEQFPQVAAQTRWLDAYRALNVTLPRPTPTSADATRARELIDAELAGVRLLTSALNERRNELALPSLLPPEVLAHIFSFLSEVYPINLAHGYYTSPSTLGWVFVTHVCRRWRHVCLGQPALWAHLDTDGRQPWNIFLERAKESPLSINGSLNRDRGNPLQRINSILAHQHHLRELTLLSLRPSQVLELADGFDGSATRLRTLMLSCSPAGSESIPLLPTSFLSRIAPNIEQLALNCVLFLWGGSYPKLTRLHYHPGVQRTHHTRPGDAIFDVVRTLRRLPVLKDLRLDDAYAEESQDFETDTPISLPSLESVSMKTKGDSCWRLWSRLLIPATAVIFISSTRRTAVGDLIAHTLRDHLRTSPYASFSTMSIQLPHESKVVFSMDDLEPIDGVSNSSCYHPAEITLHIPVTAAETLARQLASEVRLENIHDLTCDSVGIRNSRVFFETFVTARSVTGLTLVGSGAGSAIAAMRHSSTTDMSRQGTKSKSPSSRDDRVLFPNLRVLTCSTINFDQLLLDDPEDQNIRVHAALSQALALRSTTLTTLHIETCDVSKEWVDALRALSVAEVVWDEDEGELGERADEEGSFSDTYSV